MFGTIELFFGKFATYIAGFFGILSLILGLGWYVTAYQLDACNSRAKLVATQLQVSNGSYQSIKEQYVALTRQLENNQKMVLANQEIIKGNLAASLANDKNQIAFENGLKNRKPEGNCATPEDLKNAWKKL